MAVKIGIISDTHGLLRPEVADKLKSCDYILHGGDIGGERLLDDIRPLARIYAVRGNCDGDWAKWLSQSLTFTIEGVKFFMVHDKKDVARNLGDAQVVIFGHSHKYFEEMVDGRLWLNPGSCGRRRFHGELTMAVMEIRNGIYRVDKIIISAALDTSH